MCCGDELINPSNLESKSEDNYHEEISGDWKTSVNEHSMPKWYTPRRGAECTSDTNKHMDCLITAKPYTANLEFSGEQISLPQGTVNSPVVDTYVKIFSLSQF